MVTATQSNHQKEQYPDLEKGADPMPSRFLEAEKRGAATCHFEHAMSEKIVGQGEAVQALVDLHHFFSAGLHSPRRGVGNLWFLRPTVSWKTRSVEAAAEILFEDRRTAPCFRTFFASFNHPLHRTERHGVAAAVWGAR